MSFNLERTYLWKMDSQLKIECNNNLYSYCFPHQTNTGPMEDQETEESPLHVILFAFSCGWSQRNLAIISMGMAGENNCHSSTFPLGCVY